MLEIAKRRDLIQSDEHIEMKAKLEEIARMLSGLIKSLDKREV